MQSTILTLQHELKDCKQQLTQSQENAQLYQEKLETTERLLSEMRGQQNSPVSVKSEDRDELAQAQTHPSQADDWTAGVECAPGDRTSPVAQSEERKESEERILLSAVVTTVPSKPAASVPSAFSISQLLATDSNLGKDIKERNTVENGRGQHESPPLEPSEMSESPLVAAMGLVERIGCDSSTFNGEVTG